MVYIDSIISATGLIIVNTTITTTTVQGRGRRARTITNTYSKTSFGSGFVVDGVLTNGLLRNASSSTNPIIISVAHLIPEQGSSRYFFKLFDQTTKLSNLYEIDLVSYNRGIDICIFEFKNEDRTNVPLCLQWNTSELSSGQQCYVVGFPLGDCQLSIVDGTVRDPTYCFSDLGSGIDQIYHSAPVTNGNSGSCILDKDNKIIGIHAWGNYQYSNIITYENFSGGPATKCIYPILSYMLQHRNQNKYHTRVALGIHAQIVGDIFKINNFNNQYVRALDGIIVERIIPNNGNKQYTIDTHNKKIGTTKIEVGDIITHIYDVNNNEIPIGYTKNAPVNILFPRGTSSVKIKLRKANRPSSIDQVSMTYQPPDEVITLEETFVVNQADDIFYSRII